MFHAMALLLPTNNPNLDLVTWSTRFMVSIIGPTIVMALISVGADYLIYVAECATPYCGSWLGSILSKPTGWLEIAFSPLMFLGSIVAFRRSGRPIKRYDFWAVMPACLVLAVSMVSALFILVLAALPTDFQLNDTNLILIDVSAFLFVGSFSMLTSVTTGEAPGFSHIVKSLWKRGMGPPSGAPGDQEEDNNRTRSVDYEVYSRSR
jgi:hypothetical protein